MEHGILVYRCVAIPLFISLMRQSACDTTWPCEFSCASENLFFVFLAVQLAAPLQLCSSDFLADTAVYKSLADLSRLQDCCSRLEFAHVGTRFHERKVNTFTWSSLLVFSFLVLLCSVSTVHKSEIRNTSTSTKY